MEAVDAGISIKSKMMKSAFRKQRALPAIRALNKSLHPIPRNLRRNHTAKNQIKQCVFTQVRRETGKE